jgi:hypothetical protein
MKKHPTESDYAVTDNTASAVRVRFAPTNSHYTFTRLVDPDEIAQYGPFAPEPSVRHAGPTQDTDDYWSYEVVEMAVRVAKKAPRPVD